MLTFDVFAHRQLHHDQYIGTVQGPVEQFLRYPGAILQRLMCEGRQLLASLEFKIVVPVGVRRPVPAVTSHVPPAVKICDIDLHHLPRIGLVSANDRKFYVHAFTSTRDHAFTTVEKLDSLPWTTQLDLNTHSPTIVLKVFVKRFIHDDELVGVVQERVDTLLAHPGINIHSLMPPDSRGKKRPFCASIEFKIIPLDREVVVQEDEFTQNPRSISCIAGLSKSSLRAGSIGLAVGVAAGVAIILILENISFVLPPLLDKIGTFTEVASKFAEPHLHFGMAPPLLDKIGTFIKVAFECAKAHPYFGMVFVVLIITLRVAYVRFVRDLNIWRRQHVVPPRSGFV